MEKLEVMPEVARMLLVCQARIREMRIPEHKSVQPIQLFLNLLLQIDERKNKNKIAS